MIAIEAYVELEDIAVVVGYHALVEPRSFLAHDVTNQAELVAYLVEGTQREAIRRGINLTDAVWTGHGVGCACHRWIAPKNQGTL